jgi:hypothetical protein
MIKSLPDGGAALSSGDGSGGPEQLTNEQCKINNRDASRILFFLIRD